MQPPTSQNSPQNITISCTNSSNPMSLCTGDFLPFVNKTKQNKKQNKKQKTKQNKTKQNKTKQNKTKQNKTKQNKTKQNKTNDQL
jgi:hypothetical protein